MQLAESGRSGRTRTIPRVRLAPRPIPCSPRHQRSRSHQAMPINLTTSFREACSAQLSPGPSMEHKTRKTPIYRTIHPPSTNASSSSASSSVLDDGRDDFLREAYTIVRFPTWIDISMFDACTHVSHGHDFTCLGAPILPFALSCCADDSTITFKPSNTICHLSGVSTSLSPTHLLPLQHQRANRGNMARTGRLPTKNVTRSISRPRLSSNSASNGSSR